MSDAGAGEWEAANQSYLTAHVASVRALLEAHAAGRGEDGNDAAPADPEPASLPGDLPVPSLEHLCQLFSLSEFERGVLVLAAGMELDAAWPALCADAHGDTQRPYPTFGLALAVLPEPHWNALSPVAPLRFWQLVDVEPGAGLTLGALRLDERILHYLAGVDYRDEQLAGLAEPVLAPGDQLVPSHADLARRVAATWSQALEASSLPVIQLCGDEAGDKRALAVAVCDHLGLALYRMPVNSVPTAAGELKRVIRRWRREAILNHGALLLDCDTVTAADPARDGAIQRLVEEVISPLMVTSVSRRTLESRAVLTFDVEKPTTGEQRQVWQSALGARAEGLNGQVERLIGQFHLNAPMIRAACGSALGRLDLGDGEELGEVLWHTCRVQARPGLEELAQRIDPAAGWDDLVMPAAQKRLLQEIVAQVRWRPRVHDSWGFEARGARGLGIAALFAGVSGTGKTMAAEVVASHAGLDLHRIDLSTVVSKYIGETEKNLRRVFHAAEAGGAILLFDEADALFGKRTQVQDSHDRYANIEVSYLLQRMESYRGLAILTSNLKDSLDAAFLRRFRFIVDFPFPAPEQRAEIWRRVFPAETPTEGLDPQRLARLGLTGGSIRNIALSAAFLAAEAGSAVTMGHLLQAARRELAKLDKPVPEAEVRDWV